LVPSESASHTGCRARSGSLRVNEADGHPRRRVPDRDRLRHGQGPLCRLIGTGLLYNVHYAGLTISPRGVFYAGVLADTAVLADG
jgi:hypothetical protein